MRNETLSNLTGVKDRIAVLQWSLENLRGGRETLDRELRTDDVLDGLTALAQDIHAGLEGCLRAIDLETQGGQG
ncbi:hypothetical protein LWC08_06460 [Desulfobaculum bizertense]|uniref:hypothetical protein n=1 Tax=Desulfobaculum bizertense TaxID=376490 RepID=UPI001F280E7E|nr:hypothetical protein [Desulfobaculum bizertense]UIJ39210.1 hypothetical protein LWC08_06460 [Desulfobaculum bizertense]